MIVLVWKVQGYENRCGSIETFMETFTEQRIPMNEPSDSIVKPACRGWRVSSRAKFGAERRDLKREVAVMVKVWQLHEKMTLVYSLVARQENGESLVR